MNWYSGDTKVILCESDSWFPLEDLPRNKDIRIFDYLNQERIVRIVKEDRRDSHNALFRRFFYSNSDGYESIDISIDAPWMLADTSITTVLTTGNTLIMPTYMASNPSYAPFCYDCSLSQSVKKYLPVYGIESDEDIVVPMNHMITSVVYGNKKMKKTTPKSTKKTTEKINVLEDLWKEVEEVLKDNKFESIRKRWEESNEKEPQPLKIWWGLDVPKANDYLAQNLRAAATDTALKNISRRLEEERINKIKSGPYIEYRFSGWHDIIPMNED